MEKIRPNMISITHVVMTLPLLAKIGPDNAILSATRSDPCDLSPFSLLPVQTSPQALIFSGAITAMMTGIGGSSGDKPSANTAITTGLVKSSGDAKWPVWLTGPWGAVATTSLINIVMTRFLVLKR